MQCINKIKAGYDSSGKITYSPRRATKELVGFEFECRKCLPCRLNIAREKALRVWHESRCHENNIFLTLTYSEEHLKSPYLVYADFQNFMKSLRQEHTKLVTDPDLKKEMFISYMVTGEYGEINKRPHWHAIIFNYSPPDKIIDRNTDHGELVFTSKLIDKLWGKGRTEFGSVTIDSAGYVARYAAKKLVHGNDQDHDYHPLHKTSSRHAIGKKWLELNWKHCFSNGFVYLPNGQKSKIPRYYVDWLKKNHPEEWSTYVTQIRLELQEKAQAKARKEELEFLSEMLARPWGSPRPLSRAKVQLTILNSKFKRLMENLKI